jgi:hypothetical protein
MLGARHGWHESFSFYYQNSQTKTSEKNAKACAKYISKWIVFAILFICLFATLLWDMRNLSDLSRTIHDDHSSFWIPMKKKEIKKWLSPLDLCILRQNSSERSGKQNCTRDFVKKQRGAFSFQEFCGIGTGLGRECSMPQLDHRPYFQMRLSSNVIGNITRYNLRAAMKFLARSNRGLIFIGGATSKQNTQALFCALLKNDDTVSIRGDVRDPVNVTVQWTPKDRRIQPLSMDVHYIPFLGIPLAPELESNFSYTGNRDNYRHHRTDLLELKHTLAGLRQHYRGGIVTVINIGTSYISRMKFRDDIEHVLSWLQEFGEDRSNLVLFRESPATHWNHTEYGYPSLDVEADEPSMCVPIEDASTQLDWRNNEVKSIIKNEVLDNIRIIPFRDITTPLYNMHTSSPHHRGAVNCDSYCYFPQMWEGVWTSLAFGIREFLNSTSSSS